MSSPKTNEIDPLLHTVQVAKLLGVSISWLAKSRLNGTGLTAPARGSSKSAAPSR
jgi:hypothetical protein